MATTTEPIEAPQAPPPGGSDDDRSTRRMLKGLFVILALAAVALLLLLLWLLRPESSAPSSGPAGYPIEVVTTIYGYGDAPNERITQPLGVAFDGEGNVWASNTGQSRVEAYTSDGDYLRTLGDQEGDGKLFAPYGIAVDDGRGLVYVADMSGGSVQIYTTLGEYSGHLPADDQKPTVFGPDGFTPYDVELSPDGRIIVSSGDGLYFFDQEGHVVARWGGTLDNGENLRGPWDGAFNFPDSFAVDPETGWIFVADTGNKRVVAIDPEGFEKWVAGTPDTDQRIRSFWQLPRSIAIGPDDGLLYVVDTFRYDTEGMGTGHLVVLSKDGELRSEFGRTGVDDGAFSYPDQLEAGPDGLWAIADRQNNRIVVFRLHTPYPEVDDLLADRYPKNFDEPEYTWVTPPPTPPIETGEG